MKRNHLRGCTGLQGDDSEERGQVRRTLSSWSIAIGGGLAVLCLLFLQETEVRASRVTYVVFTTDVCWVCGSDFRGSYEGADYGIPFIVHRLNRHGMKGTFFVSPFCPEKLERTMKSNMDFLISSGHDIQFHPHPDVIDLTRENLTEYSSAEKRAIYEKGISALTRMGVPRPVAFRAGNYAIDRETLEMLPSLGIHIDSSIFPNDPRSAVPLPLDEANRFMKIHGTYELPITLIRFLPLPGYWGTTALDLDRTIWCEQENALDQFAAHNVPVVNIFLHFHTFYRFERPVKPFDPLQVTGVDRENIHEFDAVLNMLEHDRRFKVVTVRDLWKIFLKDPQALQGPSFIPYTGVWMTYKRSWAHFFGHGIKNKIFALAPIVVAIIVILVIAWRRKGTA